MCGGLRLWVSLYSPSNWTLRNVVVGLLIYAAGDSIAMLILGKFAFARMFALMGIGVFIYSAEIPPYFKWLSKTFEAKVGVRWALLKAACSMAFFNPLWVARHYSLIALCSGAWGEISWLMLFLGLKSFFTFSLISFLGNYIVQNVLPLNWRYAGSATLSATMGVCYAVGQALFS